MILCKHTVFKSLSVTPAQDAFWTVECMVQACGLDHFVCVSPSCDFTLFDMCTFVAHPGSLQLARQAESEAIAQLEFTAGQKMADLQAQAAKEATLSKMRDEVRDHLEH